MRIEILECERDIAKEKLANIIKNIIEDECYLKRRTDVMLKLTKDIFLNDRCVESLVGDYYRIKFFFKDDKKEIEEIGCDIPFPLSFLSDVADALIEHEYEVYIEN